MKWTGFSSRRLVSPSCMDNLEEVILFSNPHPSSWRSTLFSFIGYTEILARISRAATGRSYSEFLSGTFLRPLDRQGRTQYFFMLAGAGSPQASAVGVLQGGSQSNGRP